MRLEEITHCKWGVYAVCGSDGKAILLDGFNKLDRKYSRSMKGIYALLERSSKNIRGPFDLSPEKCHIVNNEHKIYEFIHGQLRVLWFQDTTNVFEKNRAVICSHVFLKKTQKTPKKEIENVINIKKKYLEAVQNKKIDVKR